ncbi:hypothetical protein HETIRDRAFT_438208 [Heterobasidion irregulare TC 32-1]|uniref:Uncharacterized protein n=1 Tax=Heterobasidion irregulare (strain TC 32-1) TaxID=747525 RepID=W4KIP9_HETIT|nr:uncharacterized protein HETIRDRAFT_146072 [Heterobasidion irregulare TC 32-1]XP_009542098.1 uncharacterized protein HETIRDRAFT_438208 [Heterobasidion irregulare TC 32-1]ETW85195.1 hypothetical protein HETIRDRAFT_146072 [Heterobasidion irregulare TC 32-1]ETW85225.1 hypothetical protein HETIRDRAFT_438208 [Heterobasidion irregulare TC 32-1]
MQRVREERWRLLCYLTPICYLYSINTKWMARRRTPGDTLRYPLSEQRLSCPPRFRCRANDNSECLLEHVLNEVRLVMESCTLYIYRQDWCRSASIESSAGHSNTLRLHLRRDKRGRCRSWPWYLEAGLRSDH